MAERPGVFRRMFTLFLQSFKREYDRTVVGKDHFGNVYYEEKGEKRMWQKQVHRGYIPGSTVEWRQIPPEWEAWLRGMRKQVPTQEEIEQNLQYSITVKERATKLEEKAQLEKYQLREQEDKLLAGYEKKSELFKQQSATDLSTTSSAKDKKSRKLPDISKSGGTEKPTFPTYTEFEVNPGQEKENVKDQQQK